MKTVKSILEFRYDKKPEIFDFRRILFKSVTGKEPEKELPFDDGMELKIKKEKIKIIVSSYRLAIGVEGYFEDEQFSKLIELYGKLEKLLNLGNIQRIGFRNIYCKEFSGEYNECVNWFRNKVFSKNTIINNSIDVGLPLDYTYNGAFIHTVSGPMGKEQLKNQFLEFEIAENQPEIFLFLDVDISKEKFEVSDKNLLSLFEDYKNFTNDIKNFWNNNS